MTLAITTTLTLMGMMNSVFNSSPSTSYLKAIDLFLVGCFGFTFAVLAEFCTVIALLRWELEKSCLHMIPNSQFSQSLVARLKRMKRVVA